MPPHEGRLVWDRLEDWFGIGWVLNNWLRKLRKFEHTIQLRADIIRRAAVMKAFFHQITKTTPGMKNNCIFEGKQMKNDNGKHTILLLSVSVCRTFQFSSLFYLQHKDWSYQMKCRKTFLSYFKVHYATRFWPYSLLPRKRRWWRIFGPIVYLENEEYA